MTTTPPDAPTPPSTPTPGRFRRWLDARFRTAPAVYGLIVFTALIIIGQEKEVAPGEDPTTIWDILETSVGTLVVFYIAHVFAHTLTSKADRTRDALVHSIRHAVGMLYAAVPTTIVLVLAAFDDVSVNDAVWYAMLVAVLTLGVLGYAAYAKPGTHVGIRLLGAVGAAALGFVVIILEYAFH